MEKLEKKSETIFDYIKNVIFKYCPLVDDRFYILDNAIKSPEMRIIIDFCNNETGILFMFGNGIHQSMIPESIKMDSCLDFIELKNIIEFILTDHEIIKNISNFNNRVELSFVINWSDKSKKGLSCNNIILEMNFESVELKNKYIYFIFNTYSKHLEKTPTFNTIKNDYLDNLKVSYFLSMTKQELLKIMGDMNLTQLRQILLNMDNELFIEILKQPHNDCDEKKFSLVKYD